MGNSRFCTMFTRISCKERFAFSSLTKLRAFLTILPSSLLCCSNWGKSLLWIKFSMNWTNWGFCLFNNSLMIRQLSQTDSSIFKDPGEPLHQCVKINHHHLKLQQKNTQHLSSQCRKKNWNRVSTNRTLLSRSSAKYQWLPRPERVFEKEYMASKTWTAEYCESESTRSRLATCTPLLAHSTLWEDTNANDMYSLASSLDSR